MVLILSNILFIFKDYVEKYVPQLFNTNLGSKIQNANPKFAIVPTIGVAAFAVWLYLRLDVDTTYLKHGLGFWSLWAGVVCMLGHTFLYKKNLVSTSNNNTYSQSMQQPSYNQAQQNYNQTSYNQQSMQQPQQNVKFCPGCGNKCDANADRCFMCGRQF